MLLLCFRRDFGEYGTVGGYRYWDREIQYGTGNFTVFILAQKKPVNKGQL